MLTKKEAKEFRALTLLLTLEHRRRILDALDKKPQTVGSLISRLGIKPAVMSTQLRMLRNAGFVKFVRLEDKRHLEYSVTQKYIETIFKIKDLL